MTTVTRTPIHLITVANAESSVAEYSRDPKSHPDEKTALTSIAILGFLDAVRCLVSNRQPSRIRAKTQGSLEGYILSVGVSSRVVSNRGLCLASTASRVRPRPTPVGARRPDRSRALPSAARMAPKCPEHRTELPIDPSGWRRRGEGWRVSRVAMVPGAGGKSAGLAAGHGVAAT